MEYNKSLSARIRRRNKCGFAGIGNWGFYTKDGILISYSSVKAKEGKMGDYTDENQNHKLKDKLDNIAIKNKVNFHVHKSYGLKHRAMSKKYADNHQKR